MTPRRPPDDGSDPAPVLDHKPGRRFHGGDRGEPCGWGWRGFAAPAAIAVHGLALLGDGFLHPGVSGIAVPFAGSYRPLWTGIGIIGGYGLAALGLSYYARRQIGSGRWRALHRFTVIFWLAAVVHSLAGGSDSGQAWFLAIGLLAVAPAAGLVLAWFADSAAGRRAIDLPTLDSPQRRFTE
jgi:hypothetical protein